MSGFPRTPIAALAALTGVLVASGRADAASCRAEWNTYKNLTIGSGGHKVFASQRTRGAPGTRFWWRSNDVDDASRRALAKCEEWQAGSCEIVSVDDKPKRANLDAYFQQKSFARVLIEVHDNASGKTQHAKGFTLFEPAEDGPSTVVRLITDRKYEMCVGSYDSMTFLSNRFRVSGTCFKRYPFSNEIVATGYRYVDQMKVGFSFEETFELEGSYVHVISQ